MPWFGGKKKRERPEERATVQHVWGLIRPIREHIGAIHGLLGNMGHTLARLDERTEAIARELEARGGMTACRAGQPVKTLDEVRRVRRRLQQGEPPYPACEHRPNAQLVLMNLEPCASCLEDGL
jgi:hypothetical protein